MLSLPIVRTMCYSRQPYDVPTINPASHFNSSGTTMPMIGDDSPASQA
jgi:hypothetical protein